MKQTHISIGNELETLKHKRDTIYATIENVRGEYNRLTDEFTRLTDELIQVNNAISKLEDIKRLEDEIAFERKFNYISDRLGLNSKSNMWIDR